MLIDIGKRAEVKQSRNVGAFEGSLISADFVPTEVDAAATKAEEIGRNDVPRRSSSLTIKAKTEELADTAFLVTQNRLQRELALATHHQDREEQRLRLLNTEIGKVRGKLDEVTARSEADPASTNRFVGWLLLLAAVILLVSDMPLSLQLVAKGLRITSEARLVGEPAKGPALYVRRAPVMSGAAQLDWEIAEREGRVLSASDLFRQPVTAFSLFWDVYALGLGIALLGLALKPILDILLGEEGYSAVRLWLSGVILFLFVGSTVVLGFFRGAVVEEELARPINNKLAQIEAQLASEQAKSEAERNARQIVFFNAEKSNLEKQKKDALGSGWSTPAFILLTLCLPLFGAVCFYYGTRKLDHNGIIKRMRRNLEDLESERDKRWRELAFWRSCRESREKYEDALPALERRQAVRQRCAAMYESGLDKARQLRAEALRGRDLFETLKEDAYDAFTG